MLKYNGFKCFTILYQLPLFLHEFYWNDQNVVQFFLSKKQYIIKISYTNMAEPQDFDDSFQIDCLERNTVPIFYNPRLITQIRGGNIKRKTTKYKSPRKIIDQFKDQNQAFKKLSQYKIFQNDQGLQKRTTYINGNKVEGCWKNGSLHGNVKIQYQNGQYFQGIYSNGSRIEGKVKFNDGSQYYGGFLKDLFHGKGCLKDPTGRIIGCEWYEGQAGKKAKIEYASGDLYYGQIRNLKKHGNGHIFFKNGSRYAGGFVDGQVTGYGRYYQNDVIIAEGIWQNGVLQIQQNIRQILLETIKMQKQLKFQPMIDTSFQTVKVLKD